MIPRYSRDKMARLWTREHGYALWLRVELLALQGMEEADILPNGIAREISRTVVVDTDRVSVLESQTQHEVVAFLTSIAEQAGPAGRFLHYGMTSSDMLDTALAIQVTEALAILDEDLATLLQAIRARAQEHRHTPCLARTHGRGAEPTTFGLKLLGYLAEFSRCRQRLHAARREIAFCKLSGAVGTYSTIAPSVEAYVAAALGFAVEPAPTQAIPRDRLAAVISALALLAGAIERLSIEIRHLQRQEVDEISEDFAVGQKGSSAMPHKRNPILAENLTGLARLIRGTAMPMLESMALWEERDMSHSSVERVALPDAFILADFALHRLSGIITGLAVNADRMRRNLDAMQGAFMSQRILLALVKAGHAREDAYRLVQQAISAAGQGSSALCEVLAAMPEVGRAISASALALAADPLSYLDHVDLIFDRVLRQTDELVHL